VSENRLQSMAICLSKVRYLLGRGWEKVPFATAPPPMTALTAPEAAEKFFGTGRDALVGCLMQMMAPHSRSGDAAVAHAEFVSEAEAIGLEVCGSCQYDSDSDDDLSGGGGGGGGSCDDRDGRAGGADDDGNSDGDGNGVSLNGAADNGSSLDDGHHISTMQAVSDVEGSGKTGTTSTPLRERQRKQRLKPPTRSLRDGLLWLRDRLAAMEPMPGARHDIAAELIHLHAHTRRYWVNSSAPAHAGLKVDRIPVRENEVNSYGIGAEGASERVVQNVEKTYKPGTAAGSLLMWYKQELSDPAMWVSSNRKGVITLPDLSCAYSPRPEVAVTKAGPRERDAWLVHLALSPEQPWPATTGCWAGANAQRLHGSPILDAWMDAHARGWGTRFGGGREDEEDEREEVRRHGGAPQLDGEVLRWLLDFSPGGGTVGGAAGLKT